MTNWERYEELKRTYKICRNIHAYVSKDFKKGTPEYDVAVNKALNEFDVVVNSVGVGYAHHKYSVIKNTPGLPAKDLAIICDAGSLPFGFRVQDGLIYVHTD